MAQPTKQISWATESQVEHNSDQAPRSARSSESGASSSTEGSASQGSESSASQSWTASSSSFGGSTASSVSGIAQAKAKLQRWAFLFCAFVSPTVLSPRLQLPLACFQLLQEPQYNQLSFL